MRMQYRVAKAKARPAVESHRSVRKRKNKRAKREKNRKKRRKRWPK